MKNLKSEHITLATALTILGLVITGLVYYFKNVNSVDAKTHDLDSAIKTETQARMDADAKLADVITRAMSALNVFSRNQYKMCNRLQVPCEPTQP